MVLTHQLGCSKLGGTTDRHNFIVLALKRFFLEANWNATHEHPVSRTTHKLDDLRAIDLFVEKDGTKLFVDVTVAASDCITHRKKDFAKIMSEAAERKEKTYGDVRALGYELLTFGLDTFGRLSEPSLALLRQLWGQKKALAKADIPFSAILTPLSDALAKGNAQCLWKGGLLQRLGVDTSKSNWVKRRNAPSPKDEDSELGPDDIHSPEDVDQAPPASSSLPLFVGSSVA